MKNYGEEIAYWYFRLNGFIPMSNFVRHRQGRVPSSDCDLIAVRFSSPWEEIGGMADDYDGQLLRALGCDDRRTVVTLVQVKTGRFSVDDIGIYFTQHLEYLVRRVGLLPPNQVNEFVDRFNNSAAHSTESCIFNKLALLRPGRKRIGNQPWIAWDFDHAIGFITQRFHRYSQKNRDRMFFPDSLIQFLADQAHNDAHCHRMRKPIPPRTRH